MNNFIVRIRMVSGEVDDYLIVDGRLADDRETEPLTISDLCETGAFIDAHYVNAMSNCYRVIHYNVKINSNNIETIRYLLDCTKEI